MVELTIRVIGIVAGSISSPCPAHSAANASPSIRSGTASNCRRRRSGRTSVEGQDELAVALLDRGFLVEALGKGGFMPDCAGRMACGSWLDGKKSIVFFMAEHIRHECQKTIPISCYSVPQGTCSSHPTGQKILERPAQDRHRCRRSGLPPPQPAPPPTESPTTTPMGRTPAARAMAMSKLESPIITVSSGEAPTSAMACRIMAG